MAEEMTRWLRDIDGFDGFLMISREGTSIGLTFWESREVAERHQGRPHAVRRPNAVGRGRRGRGEDDFEVVFAELGPRLTSFGP